jgi:uncharacterized protein YndB with AHSA1/START domain
VPYTIDLTIDIDAPPSTVWRALCDPAAVVRWDTTVVAALDAPPDYPQPGQHVRWRCRNTSELLHDRPQEVVEARTLRSVLEFGRQRMDETYTLSEAEGGTRLDLHIVLKVTAPFIAGPILLHAVDGPMTRRGFEASLTNLKYYCEMAAGD